MLEKLPRAVGAALKGIGPGLERTAYHGSDVAAVPETIRVTSSAFADGGPMSVDHTEDGDGRSPPIAWTGTPPEAAALVLLVEDADSPTPQPLVHALVWSLPPGDGHLDEGALPSEAGPGDSDVMGKNSFLSAEYLPPDPPPGHGPHRYLFQLFALSEAPKLEGHPGRGALLDAIRGRVIAKGVLTGTYERD